MMYDIGIIGAGPAGYVAAERAGKNGLKVVLFDARELGGVCLNEGCMPTKTLLYSAKIFDTSKEALKYGVSFDNVKFDFAEMMKRKDAVVTKLVRGVASKMKLAKVEYVNAKAVIKGKENDNIFIESDGKVFSCKNLLIATGSEAFVPPIDGLDKTDFLTNREILQETTVPKSIAIIGAGVIGIEFASLYSSLGAEVTIIEMASDILLGHEPKICAMLRKELEAKGVKFYFNSKVTSTKQNKAQVEVTFANDGKQNTVTSEKLLVAVGRKTNTEGIGLENIGVELNDKGIVVNEQCRTNVANVFAVGDVTGFSQLAHTASREAEVAVNTILGNSDFMRYDAIPSVVYTNPEVASVGLTEEQAQKKDIDFKVYELPMAYSGRFVAENEQKQGLCKVIVDEKYNSILGVHMIGNPCSEMIYGAAMAIEMQLQIKDIKELVFPHPTVSEIFRDTVFSK